MLMSAWGRSVIVGFSPDSGDQDGVMEERKSGHSAIAFERVFRRMGRYVRRVNWPDGSTGASGGCWKKAVGDTAGGRE